MEENRLPRCGGREVPVAGGGNNIKWIDLSVASPFEDNIPLVLPCSEEDYSSSIPAIGEPPISVVWKINKTSSNVLEILQISSSSELPLTGIRLSFAHALYPFAFPYLAREHITGRPVFFLYALTSSGVLYGLNITNALAYKSGSVIQLNGLDHADVRPYLNNEAQVTSVAALPGVLFLGRSNGRVSCFRPFLSPQAPLSELRDDIGLFYWLGLESALTAVKDLSVSYFHGRYLINVLHTDGRLRIWDLYTRINMLTKNLPIDNMPIPLRLWVGNADYATRIIPLAVLFRNTNDVEYITIFFLSFIYKERLRLVLGSAFHSITLQGGGLRDVRFTSDKKIWILKAGELTSQMLFHKSRAMETRSYSLHEEHISKQLFLSPASSSHDLRLTMHSLFSSTKDRIVGFVSSIFLGRLLSHETFDNVALRLTLLDYNKHWSDSEFQSLSLDELKSEILLLLEQEVTGETTISVFHWWENFCSSYLNHWRNNNEPRTLLVQSDVIGLVRNNSVSLFFSLENTEHSLGGLGMSQSEHEILLDVLKCNLEIRKQLGGGPCAMYYESITGKPVISSGEIVSRLVNILESGFAMSIDQCTWPDLGADIAWEKELEAHKNHRTFSTDMLLSLSALCHRAGSWEKVFNIMENYLQQHLVPKKFRHNNNGEALSDICSSILVQATSQFAKVNMSEQDICKLRLRLLPMIQDIFSEWLIILLFVTTPADSTSMDDCSSKLSSLQIDSSIEKRSLNKMLGKCGFPLAYILLFDDRSCIVDSGFNLRYLPDSQIITSLVQNFISWICYSKTGEDSSSLITCSSELSLRLIRNGQADALERILEVVEGSLRGEKTFGQDQDTSGDWCLVQHLRGCCLLDQVQRGACGILSEEKISEDTRCFFSSCAYISYHGSQCRASSGEGSPKALQNLAKEAEFSHSTICDSISDGEKSCATWKLHYYEWAMQIFERYSISECWKWIISRGKCPSNEQKSVEIGLKSALAKLKLA